ncbi:MFS transporter [Streptomyces sp. NPDC003996]
MSTIPSATGESATTPDSAQARSSAALRRLWRRQLPAYPAPLARYSCLAIVVLSTIVLYYALYIQYGVGTSIMAEFHMSFLYFVWMSVIGNAVGAVASLVAGLADRWGRANLVVYGLLVVGALMLALPHAPDKGTYLAMFEGIYFVEGLVLVATPALIRDFSPQLGRAGAMGFWTMGPVVGSLVVTVVTSATLDSTSWRDQLRFAGLATLAVFLLALFGLRELSPRLRDQLMVSVRDRALIEARARRQPATPGPAGHWRQMLRPDVVGSAFAISVYLLLYYSAVGNLVIYYSTVFGYTEQRANALANWYWASNAIALVLVGLLSDKLGVRKPFMLVGAVGSIVVTSLFALAATDKDTGYYHFAALFVGIGVCAGLTYAPWMASFTETVERRNPAATATGLAVWAWLLRVVVTVSAACVPVVVTSVTPLVEHGAEVQAAAGAAAPARRVISAHPALFAELEKYPAGEIPAGLQARALKEVGAADLALVSEARPALRTLRLHGAEVAQAADEGPGQWQTWWWVCVGGQAVFLPLMFLMHGRWSPRRARQDAEEHRRSVERELALLESPGMRME